MTAIPNDATWLAQTELRVRLRSSALKKLDMGVKAWKTSKMPDRVKGVRVAFTDWKRHNGDNRKVGSRSSAEFPFTNLTRASCRSQMAADASLAEAY